MKQVLLFCLSLICCYSFAQNSNNSNAIVDLALISGNVKYHYPSKHIKPTEWNKINSYILSTWQIDSANIVAPLNLYADIQAKYVEAGIDISLYKTRPPFATNNELLLKGKHWQYTGYGDSKNTFLLGPFAWFYNLFLSPYSKTLKRNDKAYVAAYANTPGLGYTQTETLVQLHDSLWLGIPIKPNKLKQSVAFKNYAVNVDEKDIRFGVSYIIDLWNILYHFSPTQESKQIWLQRLQKTIHEVQTDSSLYHVAFRLDALTDDAHNNIYNPYRLTGKFYGIDGNIYYAQPKQDTIGEDIWKVLSYNHRPVKDVYDEVLACVSSPSPQAKSFLALQEMASLRDTLGIWLHVQNINTLDTFSIKLYAQLERAENKKPISANNGIDYLDLKRIGGSKIIKTLKSASCKALVIDIRGHAYANTSFIGHFLTTKLHHFNMVTPIYRYPDKNLLVYDTITVHIKPKPPFLDKPIAVLCDETSISSSETMLSALLQCPNVTIIGRHSAGTTGNAVVAPIYFNDKMYDYMPFTPTMVTDSSGNRFKGIMPDIVITKTMQNLIDNEDEIYNAAVKYLSKEIEKR